MDGAGRSRRSRGSSGLKTDLKAAAIGAAVLLREYFGIDRKRVKARADRETPNRTILWLERMMPRRAVLMLTIATLLGSAVLGVFKGGHVDAVLTQLADSRNASDVVGAHASCATRIMPLLIMITFAPPATASCVRVTMSASGSRKVGDVIP